MANVNAPRGLVPIRHATGGVIRTESYTIASTYGYDIGRGHPVELTGTGKNIQLSAATNVDSIGVFAGCRWVDANGSQHFSNYWPASTTGTEIEALVWTDPDIIYEIQADSCAEADVGLLADWNAGTTSTTYGVSGAYAVVSAAASTDKGLRVLGLVPRVDNAYGAYAKVEVKFAEHAIGDVVAGVGGA
jgi:hypothetical protein